MDLTNLLDHIAQALPVRSPGMRPGFREWFYFDNLSVYIRLANRMIQGEAVPTLDLASVEVKEHALGQRHFSALLDGLTALAHSRGEALYVESVGSDIVRGALMRRHFIDLDGDGRNFAQLPIKSAQVGDTTQ